MCEATLVLKCMIARMKCFDLLQYHSSAYHSLVRYGRFRTNFTVTVIIRRP